MLRSQSSVFRRRFSMAMEVRANEGVLQQYMERPAARVSKSPAGFELDEPVSNSPASEGAEMQVSKRIRLNNGADVEAACGARYREELSDDGFGLARSRLQRRMLVWGYDVSRKAASEWLNEHRFGDGAVDGCAGFVEYQGRGMSHSHTLAWPVRL